MEILLKILEIIGVLLPIIIEIIKLIKGKEKATQSNVVTVSGNNNSINQHNEKTIINVKNYHNNYYDPNYKKNETTPSELIVCFVFFALVLFGIYLQYSSLIYLIYVFVFPLQMLISCFSPQKRKDAIILYILNLIIAITVFSVSSKEFWTDEMISMYSSLSKNFTIPRIIDSIFNMNPYAFYKVVLLSLFQLLACGSAVCQFFLHIFNIIRFHILRRKNKEITNKVISSIFNNCFMTNILPIALLCAYIAILLCEHFSK